MPSLPEIPCVDIRPGSPVDLLEHFADRAKALARATTETFGRTSRLGAQIAFPITDRMSRDWLIRSANPYTHEIDAIATRLGIRGVHTLNICFEWGCTSFVVRSGVAVSLHRVLDWKFPALGQHLVVAHQSGTAGEFFNVTWPGLSGMYHGMAPGRFAAAINQAPMRLHGSGLALAWAKNRLALWNETGLPAAHLLRAVFETAGSYAEAKLMLFRTPIAVPAIFILAGLDEGCVIERTERQGAIREMKDGRVCASNHFETELNRFARGWHPRSGDSPERLSCAEALPEAEFHAEFAWFRPPIANDTSRVVMDANPTRESLSVMGVAGEVPVTEVLRLRAQDMARP